MTTENQARVEAFMRAGGQAVRSEPTLVDGNEAWHRYNFLGSEFNEYKAGMKRCLYALTNPDSGEGRSALVELADALADMMYVMYGTAAAYGIDLDAVFDEVCDSNDSKIDWENGKPWVVKPSGKVGKNERFREPDIGSVIFGD